jgi:OHCU decarboxylase
MRLFDLNALSEDAATAEFLLCCGSTRWATRMAASRPFTSVEGVLEAGDDVWQSLDAADWLEAFAAHPKIGERTASAWAAQEQSGVRGATAEVRDGLGRGNQRYQERFGYIFIICATGKTSGEMLSELERRLTNTADDELRIAAEEQRKITRIRILKLLSDMP